MNLNQVTLPATNVERSADFYRALGFTQIVTNLPSYARFECPDGEATFSLHRVASVAPDSGWWCISNARTLTQPARPWPSAESSSIRRQPIRAGYGAKPICAIRTAIGFACTMRERTDGIRRGVFDRMPKRGVAPDMPKS